MGLDCKLWDDFGIKFPKIAISGLNPHVGDKGTIGNEEKKYIIPSINKLKKNKININGPFSADSLFTVKNLRKFNTFVCMYHDQGLIPFKLINKFNALNYTGSLDIIRISPNHGTAYNLIGKNKANFSSLLYCFNSINKFIKNRSKIVKT